MSRRSDLTGVVFALALLAGPPATSGWANTELSGPGAAGRRAITARHPPRWLKTSVLAVAAVGAIMMVRSVVHPQDIDDACALFDGHPSWYRAAQVTRRDRNLPIPHLLAIMNVESSFRGGARPNTTILGVRIPFSYQTSALGYAQATDPTWKLYQDSTGRTGASRESFADAADFIGWYAQRLSQQTGIRPKNVDQLYLAYHEGPGGYNQGSHRNKPWLLGKGREVAHLALTYEQQLRLCGADLKQIPERRVALDELFP